VRRSRCKGRSALALAAVRNGRSAPAQTIGTRVVIDGVLAGGKFGARGLRAAYVVALDDGQRPFRGLCLQQQGCSPSEGARRGRSSATERSAIEQQGRTPARRRVIRSGSTARAAAGPSTSDGTPSVASSDVLFTSSDVQFTMIAAKESRWAARPASRARRRYSCPTTARQARQRSTPRSDRPRRAGDHSRPSSGPRFTDPTHRSPVPDALFSRTEQANGARG
jgi:hypothetical protein